MPPASTAFRRARENNRVSLAPNTSTAAADYGARRRAAAGKTFLREAMVTISAGTMSARAAQGRAAGRVLLRSIRPAIPPPAMPMFQHVTTSDWATSPAAPAASADAVCRSVAATPKLSPHAPALRNTSHGTFAEIPGIKEAREKRTQAAIRRGRRWPVDKDPDKPDAQQRHHAEHEQDCIHPVHESTGGKERGAVRVQEVVRQYESECHEQDGRDAGIRRALGRRKPAARPGSALGHSWTVN